MSDPKNQLPFIGKDFRPEDGGDASLYALGSSLDLVTDTVQALEDGQVLSRIWAHDHTVWSAQPDEITNRLGWLTAPQVMQKELGRIDALTEEVIGEGMTDVVLLGMGGSSLAAEAFAGMFREHRRADGLRLTVIDSSDPDCVRERTDTLPLAKTLVLVATKSGSTVETLSAFKYIYRRMLASNPAAEAGKHFVAITDEGSALHQLARTLHFRTIFLNDSTVGGRYSALTHFGLVPTGLIGIDISRLLGEARHAAGTIADAVSHAQVDREAAMLGALLGRLATDGVNKLTLSLSEELAPLGMWVEQLVAESTGKGSTGILPVVGEGLHGPDRYEPDRLFLDIRLAGDNSRLDALDALSRVGHPVVVLTVQDLYAVGGQMFLWELATAVAAHCLGVHPFDQPDVEAAKRGARTVLRAYQADGELPDVVREEARAERVLSFLADTAPGDYIAIQAFVNPTSAMAEELERLRAVLGVRFRVPTTVGIGPRFLHSTGQLHKGDGGRGWFLQLTSEPVQDIGIPDTAEADEASVSFQVLKSAQAVGDARALLDAGRPVLQLGLGADSVAELRRLVGDLRALAANQK